VLIARNFTFQGAASTHHLYHRYTKPARKVDFYGRHRAGPLLRLVGDSRAYPQPNPTTPNTRMNPVSALITPKPGYLSTLISNLCCFVRLLKQHSPSYAASIWVCPDRPVPVILSAVAGTLHRII